MLLLFAPMAFAFRPAASKIKATDSVHSIQRYYAGADARAECSTFAPTGRKPAAHPHLTSLKRGGHYVAVIL